MIEKDPLLNPVPQIEDEQVSRSVRPLSLDAYIGQEEIKSQMALFVEAAKKRGEALDHCLIYGSPGLGKTTLANVIAKLSDAHIHHSSGAVLERSGDLAAILTKLKPFDILFIDEIHRLNPAVEEVLYPALEDFKIDIMIGEGMAAHSLQVDLPHFTLIGATTRAGMLTSPLRDRFGIIQRLEFYSTDELRRIVERSAGILEIKVESEGALEIAKRARGTPRIANRLLRRVRDFATIETNGLITHTIAVKALSILRIDKEGLDPLDQRYLSIIIKNFGGGPVGLGTLSTAINEESGTLEDMVEPYLIQLGFLKRTPRGRVVTDLAYQHAGLPKVQPSNC